jgi:hypothetical protein
MVNHFLILVDHAKQCRCFTDPDALIVLALGRTTPFFPSASGNELLSGYAAGARCPSDHRGA